MWGKNSVSTIKNFFLFQTVIELITWIIRAVFNVVHKLKMKEKMEVPVVGIVAVSRSRGLIVAGAGIILMGRHQRIYISLRTDTVGQHPPSVFSWKDSPNLSPLCLQFTSLPVRLYNCRQSRRREVAWESPSN